MNLQQRTHRAFAYFSSALILITAAIVIGHFTGCTELPIKTNPSPVAPQKPSEDTLIVPSDLSSAQKAKVSLLVNSSACAKYSWKYGQGVAPMGFMKGMAMVYLRAFCHQTRADVAIMRQPIGDAQKDALAHYGRTNGNNLRQLFTLMLGHGMLESSGRYCCGRDIDAHNVASESAEAGLFQTSWDSHSVPGAPSEEPALFKAYQADQSGCLLDVFKEGVSTCRSADLKNWGTGTGVIFQDLSKKCPAFEVEYSAMVLRTNRTHYGPINTKKSEYRDECEQMLAQVESVGCQ